MASSSKGNSQSTKERCMAGGRPRARHCSMIEYGIERRRGTSHVGYVSGSYLPEEVPSLLYHLRVEVPATAVTVFYRKKASNVSRYSQGESGRRAYEAPSVCAMGCEHHLSDWEGRTHALRQLGSGTHDGPLTVVSGDIGLYCRGTHGAFPRILLVC